MPIPKYTDHKELTDAEFTNLKENVIKGMFSRECNHSFQVWGFFLLTIHYSQIRRLLSLFEIQVC